MFHACLAATARQAGQSCLDIDAWLCLDLDLDLALVLVSANGNATQPQKPLTQCPLPSTSASDIGIDIGIPALTLSAGSRMGVYYSTHLHPHCFGISSMKFIAAADRVKGALTARLNDHLTDCLSVCLALTLWLSDWLVIARFAIYVFI